MCEMFVQHVWCEYAKPNFNWFWKLVRWQTICHLFWFAFDSSAEGIRFVCFAVNPFLNGFIISILFIEWKNWMFLLFGLLGIISKYIVDYIFTVHIPNSNKVWFFRLRHKYKFVWLNWFGIANIYYYLIMIRLIHFNSFENIIFDYEFRKYKNARIKIYQSTKLLSVSFLADQTFN